MLSTVTHLARQPDVALGASALLDVGGLSEALVVGLSGAHAHVGYGRFQRSLDELAPESKK